tara:strand:- start:1269 stop:2090 length:822 start_codon:yes stop_codon:yes gene_type:complete
MPSKQLDEKIYTNVARRLADNLRVDALNKWNLNESTLLLTQIIDATYRTIKHAQKSHFEQCEKQHKFLLVGINRINAYIDEIEVIGNSDVGDMIELSNAFINTIKMSYTKLLSHGIDLRISPLHHCFENIIERLEDITNPKRIERAIAINKLKSKEVNTPTANSSTQDAETLSSLITHEQSDLIVSKLKVDFKNIKGKGLKILLMALQKVDLIPTNQNVSSFHRSCENEFNWEIASYVALNDSKFHNDKRDLRDLNNMINKLENIKRTIKPPA